MTLVISRTVISLYLYCWTVTTKNGVRWHYLFKGLEITDDLLVWNKIMKNNLTVIFFSCLYSHFLNIAQHTLQDHCKEKSERQTYAKQNGYYAILAMLDRKTLHKDLFDGLTVNKIKKMVIWKSFITIVQLNDPFTDHNPFYLLLPCHRAT